MVSWAIPNRNLQASENPIGCETLEMGERSVQLAHTTAMRRVQRCVPEFEKYLNLRVQAKS
jgi:hypothetical protein